jgi:hypothetical protein
MINKRKSSGTVSNYFFSLKERDHENAGFFIKEG